MWETNSPTNSPCENLRETIQRARSQRIYRCILSLVTIFPNILLENFKIPHTTDT